MSPSTVGVPHKGYTYVTLHCGCATQGLQLCHPPLCSCSMLDTLMSSSIVVVLHVGYTFITLHCGRAP
jgi:hypothetical protein